jgi:rRNA maturation protein Rpf1
MPKPTRAPSHDDIRAKKLSKQITDMKLGKKRIPKTGDRVIATGHHGVFFVSEIKGQTAKLTNIGSPELKLILNFQHLQFLDELDESQNALRIVRESTEGK